MSADLLNDRMQRRVVEMRAAEAKARATDACAHVRKAMAILEPAAQAPELQRVFDLLDEVATILIEELGREAP